MRLLLIFACLTLLIALPHHARAQDTSALINQALDRRETFEEWKQVPMQQVLDAIKEQTGLPLEVQPAVWDLLPWGRDTAITATLENLPLREALGAITRQLGLTYVVREEVVQIRPAPALTRLGRRATPSELRLLAFLAEEPMRLETDRPTVAQLLDAVDQRLMQHRPDPNEPAQFDLEHRAHPVVPNDQIVFVPRNATMMAALESLVAETPATWYPWERSVLLVSKEMHIRNQLSKTITRRYENEQVEQVLNDLSRRSGVPFIIEPGAIQRIPADARVIRILGLENVTFIQALENLAGVTGLGYIIRAEDVYIWHQAAVPVPAPRDPVIAIITLPELGIQVPLPESQVPQDLRQFIRHKTRKEMENWRQMMQEEGFVPAAEAE